MSCFIHTDEHLSKCANFLANGNERLARKLFAQIKRANISAYNQRYAHHNDPEPDSPFGFLPAEQWTKDNGGILDALKGLQSLRYQMMEGDVPETDLYKWLDGIINSMRQEIAAIAVRAMSITLAANYARNQEDEKTLYHILDAIPEYRNAAWS